MIQKLGIYTKLLQEEDKAPLQKKMNDLGKILGYIAIAICVIIFILGIFKGRDIVTMLITS